MDCLSRETIFSTIPVLVCVHLIHSLSSIALYQEVCTPEFRGFPGEEKVSVPRSTVETSVDCYLMQVDTADRCGALFDVVTVLFENDVMVHRAHASTSPMGRVIDLFYITDQRKELPSESRIDQLTHSTRERLQDASCKISIGRAPEVISSYGTLMTLTPSIVDNKSARPALSLQRSASSSSSFEHLRRFSSDEGSLSDCSTSMYEPDESFMFGGKVEVDIDNKLSRVHTVIQMRSKDRKGLLYDLLRTLKDVNTQVSYGKIEVDSTSQLCKMVVFVQKVNSANGCTRIADADMQQELCIRVHQALACPVRISAVNLGTDEMCTRLVVGAAVDSGGRGRPRVLHDTSRVLKQMSLSVFKMDMYLGNTYDGMGNVDGRPDNDCQEKEEVHRFIVTDELGYPIKRDLLKVLAKRVHDALMDVC